MLESMLEEHAENDRFERTRRFNCTQVVVRVARRGGPIVPHF